MSLGATLVPFADDSSAITIGKLSIENGTDSVAISGSLDITRDKAGLRRARTLLDLLQAAVRDMEGDESLPDSIAPPEVPDIVSNPHA